MTGTHNVNLLILSVVIALIGYSLLIPIDYDLPIVLVSMAVAVVAAARAFGVNISKSKRAESALRMQQEFLRNVIDTAPSCIFVKDWEGKYTLVNQATAELFGTTIADIIGKTDADINADQEQVKKILCHDKEVKETLREKLIFEETVTDTTGQVRWFQTIKKPLISSDGTRQVLGVAIDITKRKQAEEALRKSEARNRALVDAIPDLMIRMTKDGTYLDFKPAKDFKTVMIKSDMTGKNLYEVMPLDVAQQRMHYVERALQTGNTQSYEFQFLLDGSIQHEEARIVVSGEDEVLAIIRDISDRKRTEAALQKAHDELENRVEERTTELRNTNGQLLVEIAERQRVEEETKKLNQDLKCRAVELETVNKELEAFSYSVSHDLRAPLRAINGFSRILLNEYAPQLAPEAKRYLLLVRDNAQQMGCLVDDLLTFSRLGRSPLKKQRVHHDDLVRQALANLGSEQQSRHVEISLSDLPTAQADSTLLKQVWVNLLANSLKFTRQRDVARISIGWEQIDREHVYFVKDNGVGFDMRYADKLFGVFQRLHRAEEYEGTGVGLAIVQRIIHRHGGRVWAEAEVNTGATFYFTLGGDISDDRNRGRNPVS